MDYASSDRGLSSGLRQQSELTLQQRLSPMQVRYVRMLEMNQQEAEDAVERELADNPALALDEESGPAVAADHSRETASWRQARDVSADETAPVWTRQADDSVSIYDFLEEQLRERDMTDEDSFLARYIVGNLDANGYLQRSVAAMTDDLAFGPGIEVSPGQMKQAMEVVRSLDPPGVGAVDLRDALLLQLRRMPESAVVADALRIIEECFEAFTMKHTHRIVSQLKMDAGRVEKAVGLIVSLNPKPGSAVGSGRDDVARPIVPDFVVDVYPEGEISVGLPSGIPELAIEQGFVSAVKLMERNRQRRKDSDAEFVMSRYNDARDFIEILRQRRDTLYAVMTAVSARQKEYLLTGDEHTLRPLGLKDIAADTGYDVSTVSRATAGKYAATPYGVLPLRFFFSEGYGDDGDAVSARAVQAALRAIVRGEDKRHPFSDERLCAMLLEKGYEVSRRTVAKYRDRLGIPVARLRKEIGKL